MGNSTHTHTKKKIITNLRRREKTKIIHKQAKVVKKVKITIPKQQQKKRFNINEKEIRIINKGRKRING